MRKGVLPHEVMITEVNVAELGAYDFVFICVDKGTVRELIVGSLAGHKTPFIDVGMGVQIVDEDASLVGTLRTTVSTEHDRSAFRKFVNLEGKTEDDGYGSNIQIADLNALNAALAVVKWKKLCRFYHDRMNELHSTYTIDIHLLWREVVG